MSQDVLIPQDLLSPTKEELYARIARLKPDIILDAGIVGEALGWSLLFERWPNLLPGPLIDSEVAFYNQYFWFKRFATLKQERDGYDAGLEQQVFHLLEQADFDVDWSLLERLDTEATGSRD